MTRFADAQYTLNGFLSDMTIMEDLFLHGARCQLFINANKGGVHRSLFQAFASEDLYF